MRRYLSDRGKIEPRRKTGTCAKHQRRLTVPPDVVALVAWRPMTDALLETPGRELLRQPPPLGASILDTGTGGNLR